MMAATEWDRRKSRRPGFNRYALPQYFDAIESATAQVALGLTWDAALEDVFEQGPLLNYLLRVPRDNNHD
jgi:hypothetical protein